MNVQYLIPEFEILPELLFSKFDGISCGRNIYYRKCMDSPLAMTIGDSLFISALAKKIEAKKIIEHYREIRYCIDTIYTLDPALESLEGNIVYMSPSIGRSLWALIEGIYSEEIAIRDDADLSGVKFSEKPEFVEVHLQSGTKWMLEDSSLVEVDGEWYREGDEGVLFYKDSVTEEYFLSNIHHTSYRYCGKIHHTIMDVDLIYVEGHTYLDSDENREYYDLEYCDRCDEYSRGRCEECIVNLLDYQSGEGRADMRNGCLIGIGLEVEKEDYDVRNSRNTYDLLHGTGWALERDGSLDEESGFELVSPILGLSHEPATKNQDGIITQLRSVKNYLDADFSHKCGGHINVSVAGMSSSEILNSIRGYVPLLMALYPERRRAGYSYFQNFKEYSTDEKYNAFYLKNDILLEMRIFPAIWNYEDAIWRIELVRIMLTNEGNNSFKVLNQLADRSSELYQHLDIKAGISSIPELISNYAEFARTYNHVQYSNMNEVISFITDGLKVDDTQVIDPELLCNNGDYNYYNEDDEECFID